MSIRKGNIKDLKPLLEIGRLAYSEYQNVLDNQNWNKLNNILNDQNSIENLIKKSIPFIYEVDNKIAGVIYFFSSGNPTELYSKDVCYIRSLGVNPEYRGLGIGRKLTQFCVDFATKKGEKIMALHTSEFMHTARSMYEKMGFVRQKEFESLGKKYWIFTKQLSV